MPIRATCPTCHKQCEGADEWAGRKATCQNCGGVVEFPTSNDWPELNVVEALRPPLQSVVSSRPSQVIEIRHVFTGIRVPFSDILWWTAFHAAAALIVAIAFAIPIFLLMLLLSEISRLAGHH